MPLPLEAEAAALRKHLEYALYPELANDIEAVQRAVTATAAGRFGERITFARGRVEEAVMVCAVLDRNDVVVASGARSSSNRQPRHRLGDAPWTLDTERSISVQVPDGGERSLP